MAHYGDFAAGKTVYMMDYTESNYAPTNLAGLPSSPDVPAFSVYKDDNTTQSQVGVTGTIPFDSTTGLFLVKIDTSADASFYAADHIYHVVITSATLGGVSKNGYVVGSFRLTTLRTNLDKMTNAVARGTVTTGASTTSVPTSALSIAGAAASGVVADQFKGASIMFDGDTATAGLRGAVAAITATSASNTPTFTVGTLPATPASGDTFSVI